MMNVLTMALTVTLLFSTAFAQSLSGIKVGDSSTVLEKLNLEPLFMEGHGAIKMVKYRLANGNELSVTYNSRENRIIYIENDWSLKPEGFATDLPAFKFGITTLADIRRVNGSNGFSWKSMAMNRTEDQLVTFNAYEIKGKPNVIAVFVTSLNIREAQKNMSDTNETAKFFKLQAIILAEEAYLDELWGEEKIYDKDSKPISWDK